MTALIETRRTVCRLVPRIIFLTLITASFAHTASAQSPRENGAHLSADASYIPLADAIKRAKAEGASGDVVQIDLEWDTAHSVVTWDVTFSSGTEYELDAVSGKFLGTKPKSPAKLAQMLPLVLDGSAKKLLTFQEIIKRAEKSRGQAVIEMELKHMKGQAEAVFELSLADGKMLYYSAATGNTVAGN
jgi:uncharacterized membrane protein YkoI